MVVVGSTSSGFDVRMRNMNQQDRQDYIYDELWRTCAGPLVTIPCVGEKVFYFPQGHMEQIDGGSSRDSDRQMPTYNLPSQILCKVVNIDLMAERDTDDVFAHLTLLLETEHTESTLEETIRASAPKPSVVSFCKILTASDTSTHGGFAVLKRHADECLPPLDMMQNPPARELLAKDLHGTEWRFRHIYRGQPKRHLLTTGWSTFVNSKKLVAGDAVIFLRGENGQLRVGVRRATNPRNNASASVISTESMQIGVLASASHAIATGTMFSVYYRPRTSPSEFLVSYNRYMESMKTNYSACLRFQMKFEGGDGQEERCACIITGMEDAEPATWPNSKWKCLKVQWEEIAANVQPERVSPWELIPFSAAKVNSSSTWRSKRQRAHHLPSATQSSTPQRDGSSTISSEPAAVHHEVLQGQEEIARGQSFPVECNANPRLMCQPIKVFGVYLVENRASPMSPSVATSDEVHKSSNDGFPGQQKTAKKCESTSSASINAQFCLTHPVTARSCTKVHKQGTALGRSVDLSKFNGYKELISELDKMFEFGGGLANGSKGWKVIYTDDEGNIKMIADCLWPEFVSTVRKMYIYLREEGGRKVDIVTANH